LEKLLKINYITTQENCQVDKLAQRLVTNWCHQQ